jgi:hypothetical protein
MDFGRGFGQHYDEYKCVAWTGPSELQKPLVYYTYESEKRWITHPQIDLIVQRYTKGE